MSKILIVSPAFNEEAVIEDFLETFLKIRALRQSEDDLRVLVVNDGSKDSTLDKLKAWSSRYPDMVYYISFFSNFGHQSALMAGLEYGSRWADAIITMDCDLEHPLELVPELIDTWKSTGSLIVNTKRRSSTELP